MKSCTAECWTGVSAFVPPTNLTRLRIPGVSWNFGTVRGYQTPVRQANPIRHFSFKTPEIQARPVDHEWLADELILTSALLFNYH